MIALIQRVSIASVVIAGSTVASIGLGLLAFIGVEKKDSAAHAGRLADKLLDYRVFSDEQGKMNRCLRDVNGSILLVSQFTLVAKTHKGLRPSFSAAAPPEQGAVLFQRLIDEVKARYAQVASGVFGADMQISLVNDGPVTFWLQV